MPRQRGRLPDGVDEPVVDVVHLDGGEPKSLHSRNAPRLAHEVTEPVAGGAVPVAAEVDAGQDDLAMALCDAAADLPQYRRGGPASRRSTNERHDAEIAREAAAVLNLHERTDPLEPCVGLDAPDRADALRHDIGRVLA